MKWVHVCIRCGMNSDGVRYWSMGADGMLCDDCNLKAGLFHTLVLDSMLDFSGHIKRITRKVVV